MCTDIVCDYCECGGVYDFNENNLVTFCWYLIVNNSFTSTMNKFNFRQKK